MSRDIMKMTWYYFIRQTRHTDKIVRHFIENMDGGMQIKTLGCKI